MSESTCMLPACDRTTYSRRLCRGCYCAAQRRIKAGRYTWAELVKWGLAGDTKPRIHNPMSVALEKKAGGGE